MLFLCVSNFACSVFFYICTHFLFIAMAPLLCCVSLVANVAFCAHLRTHRRYFRCVGNNIILTDLARCARFRFLMNTKIFYEPNVDYHTFATTNSYRFGFFLKTALIFLYIIEKKKIHRILDWEVLVNCLKSRLIYFYIYFSLNYSKLTKFLKLVTKIINFD